MVVSPAALSGKPGHHQYFISLRSDDAPARIGFLLRRDEWRHIIDTEAAARENIDNCVCGDPPTQSLEFSEKGAQTVD